MLSETNIYLKRAHWRLWLIGGGAIIVLVTLLFTYSISKQLKAIVENNMDLYALAFEELNKDAEDLSKDVEFPSRLINSNQSIRTLIVDEQDEIYLHSNFPPRRAEDDKYLQRQLQKMKKSKFKPIDLDLHGTGQKIYYAPPIQYTLLTYLPLVVLLLLASYIIMGYLGFDSSRKAEQNKVWVGMARETAHQLGTPISAIIAWIENLKITPLNEEQSMYISELEKDIEKLDLIADRFSKIGAEPVLQQASIVRELDSIVEYMKSRAPRKIEFEWNKDPNLDYHSYINQHLFSWVLENLIRNAIDAMGPQGQISVTLEEKDGQNIIYLKDSGKGIAPKDVKNVFKPGFTTKKRGWGLGLSLAKRIIEEYHRGKLILVESKPNEGTTFAIALDKADPKQEKNNNSQ